MKEDNKEKEVEKPLHLKLLKEVENSIETLLNQGITVDNVETLSELVDIHKDIIKEREEIQNMNYGNYGNYRDYNGRGPGHGSYGEYNRGYGEYNGYGNYGESYGRRGVDSRYRGYDHLDRMAGEYGRYSDSRERYGAGEEVDKAQHYMVKSLEDFVKFLYEDAQTPQQKQMITEALQRSMMQ